MEQRFELRLQDQGYPPFLRETPDPPEVLYGRGDPSALVSGLAVIGARRATPSGLDITRTFTAWASRAGYTVISGGAYGCDQAAHVAALEAGGVTVTVMGCGADVAYPRCAEPLFGRIVSAGGVVVSEHAWGTTPQPWMFRRRNRIIAGLSAAVLVVEAGLPSGTFSTADDALAAGRTVLAVPGSVLSEYSRGCNRLIRQGATPVSDVSDLRDELSMLLGPPRGEGAVESLTSGSEGDAVLDAIRATPMRPDDLGRRLGIDIVAVARRIGRLEELGLVARHYDGTYHATLPR